MEPERAAARRAGEIRISDLLNPIHKPVRGTGCFRDQTSERLVPGPHNATSLAVKIREEI